VRAVLVAVLVRVGGGSWMRGGEEGAGGVGATDAVGTDQAPAVLAIVDAPLTAAEPVAPTRQKVEPSTPAVTDAQILAELATAQQESDERTVTTQIAVMPERLATLEVFVEPSDTSDTKITFQRYDEFNEVRIFRIIEQRGEYFHVQVPMRPNGSTGWIRVSDVEVTSTDQRILIDLSDRSITVWNGQDVVFEAIGTIGQERTPTPVGDFYVRSVFDWYADSIYGPFVMPLSAYSESIDQINGGDAVVAIHGTQRPDLVGAAASLGCFRLDNDTLRELAAIIEAGAPVQIVA